VKIITRTEAELAGLTRYFTGKRCCRGHIAQRGCGNGTCVVCMNEDRRRYSAARRQRLKTRQREGDRAQSCR
jgi:hypothetical protein